ncbi:hypothetical protein AG1IA_01979 [Rhizoctonia solani AG-1 IA]|uniref:Uncharacterized protein n=1 Tax=Thanatephorus cucumeris (strain AG1-IA) TaxID=983506 RepID=L8X4P2_THACA|nr:hypothetical protein AG1IA_01979 [Rhizoctonia solani AG-1 IA]
MVQWGGFIEQRDEDAVPSNNLLKERHVAYWDENHDNPELELWRFETGFDHGWGAGNNEEDGELAEQRLQEHIDEGRAKEVMLGSTSTVISKDLMRSRISEITTLMSSKTLPRSNFPSPLFIPATASGKETKPDFDLVSTNALENPGGSLANCARMSRSFSFEIRRRSRASDSAKVTGVWEVAVDELVFVDVVVAFPRQWSVFWIRRLFNEPPAVRVGITIWGRHESIIVSLGPRDVSEFFSVV